MKFHEYPSMTDETVVDVDVNLAEEWQRCDGDDVDKDNVGARLLPWWGPISARKFLNNAQGIYDAVAPS